MINETARIAYLATRETNNMLTEVQVISYGHHRCICSSSKGGPQTFPTELLFHTREGAVEFTRERFLNSIATAKKELKLLEDQLAYLDKLSQRIAV